MNASVLVHSFVRSVVTRQLIRSSEYWEGGSLPCIFLLLGRLISVEVSGHQRHCKQLYGGKRFPAECCSATQERQCETGVYERKWLSWEPPNSQKQTYCGIVL